MIVKTSKISHVSRQAREGQHSKQPPDPRWTAAVAGAQANRTVKEDTGDGSH